MNKTLQVFFYLSILVLIHSCTNRQSGKEVKTIIHGNIQNLIDSTIILEEWKINEIIKIEEVLLVNGQFTFNTELVDGAMYLVKLGGYKLPIIIDSDSIYITGTSPEFLDLKIKGSEASNQLLTFSQQIDILNNEIAYNRAMYDSLMKVGEKDSLIKYYHIKHEQGLMDMSNVIKAYADTTTHFHAAMYSIRKLDPNTEVDFFERFINNLTKRFPKNNSAVSFVNMMKQNIDKIQKTGVSVGADAPDFTLRDMENNPVNLSEYKGNYVLITFWASWCPPCRHENKSLVQVYDSFHTKNFKMIHVSIDKDLGKLKRAIEKDGLKWIMLNDPNEWEANIVNLYGFHKIPSNYLIDPEGKIIAKNLFGNELVKNIQDIYEIGVTSKELE